MKTQLAVLTFISLALVAAFGFAVMNESGGHCVASAVQGTTCPASALGFASFHLSFFKNLSSAVLVSLGALFLAAFASFVLFVSGAGAAAGGARYFSAVPERGFLPSKKKRSRWFSLLENSPNPIPALR